MKRRRHTPEQIVRKLREVERLLGEGQTAKQVEISEQTCHRWRNQYGGMKADDAKRLRELEREKARLKRIFAPFLANRSRARLTVTRATLALDRRKRAPGREDTGTRRHGQGRGCHRRTPRRSPKQVRVDAWWRAPATRKPRNEPCRAALGRGLTMLTEQAMSRQRRALLGRGGQRPRTTVSGTPLRGPLASRRAPPRRPLTGLRGSAHTRAPPERPRPRPHGPHIRAPSRRAPADPRGQHRPTPPGRPPASPRGQHSPTPARRPPASPRGHHSPTPSRRPPASPRGHHSPTPSERRATHRARRRFRRTLLVVPRRNSSGVLRTPAEPPPNQKPLCHPLTPQHHNTTTMIILQSYER